MVSVPTYLTEVQPSFLLLQKRTYDAVIKLVSVLLMMLFDYWLDSGKKNAPNRVLPDSHRQMRFASLFAEFRNAECVHVESSVS
jgi:hypothetical protein